MSQAKVMGDKGANGPNAKLSKSGAVFDSANTTFTHDMYPAHEIRRSSNSINTTSCRVERGDAPVPPPEP